MKYTCTDAGNGVQYDLKAKNDTEAVLEAYSDMSIAFDEQSRSIFARNVKDGNTFCYIDKWADGAEEDDEPVASASIAWGFEYWTDYNENDGYKLTAVEARLFDGTELTIKGDESFEEKVRETLTKPK